MDASDKIRELKADINKISDEEKSVKGRINELKQLVEDKKKREESLAALKAQEAELMKELGLV